MYAIAGGNGRIGVEELREMVREIVGVGVEADMM